MRWTRRDFFTGSASAVAGGYWLFPGLGLAEPVPDKFDGTAFKLAAPEPNAKSGGVLRMGIPNRPPHFDIHQSGTFFNLGAQGCMFDNLVRAIRATAARRSSPTWRTAGRSPRTARPTPSSCAKRFCFTTGPS